MKNVLEYKGYLTRIEYSVQDRVLYGKIEGIKDLVNFESDSVDGIVYEFHCAVDDYLEMCAELGETPDKAYSGTFNVRVSPILHRKLAMQAIREGETLNSTVEKAIRAYTDARLITFPRYGLSCSPSILFQSISFASFAVSSLLNVRIKLNTTLVVYNDSGVKLTFLANVTSS